MKDWYPSQDSKRAVFLENFVANMDKACGVLGVSTSAYAESIAATRAWLTAYAQRQEAQRDFDKALLLYSCRTGEEAFALLGTYTLGRIEDTRPNRVASQPEQRQYYAVYMDKDQPTGSQSATVGVVAAEGPTRPALR